MSASVSIRGLDFHFDGRDIFQDLCLDIPAKKWTCLLGPSGCGKSTLLRLVSGGLAPDGGQIVCNQKDLSWLAQDDLLFPWLSVLENVCLGHRLRGKINAEVRDRARELLARAGLSGWEKSLPEQLSGGMRQRVALLRTLMESRSVILMDEPFSRLDALTRLRLQDLAAELLQDKTVLLVTHDPQEALRLGHVLYLLSGSPTRVVEKICPPHNPVRNTASPNIVALHQNLVQTLIGGGKQ